MPRCANGHAQGLVLKCSVCGSDVSYRDACAAPLKLPVVKPDLGPVQAVTAGFPAAAAWSSVGIGDASTSTSSQFTVQRIQGGSWLDYHSKYSGDLARWLKLTGFDRSTCRFAMVDASAPTGVMTVGSIPRAEKTVVVALVADPNSTPVELSSSYAAVSKALEMGFSVVALGQGFVREALVFDEGRVIISQTDAAAKIIKMLVGDSAEVVDLLERDLRLGVRLHCLSAMVSGSKRVYGSAENAFSASGHGLSIEAGQDDVKTLYPLVFADESTRAEFTGGFSQVRTRSYPQAHSAESLFHPSPNGGSFDILTLYGVGEEVLLSKLAPGYNEVLQRVPSLKVENLR